MIAQIIWIILIVAGLMLESYRHGKPKEGKHNVWATLFATLIGATLLYFGGFFDPLLK